MWRDERNGIRRVAGAKVLTMLCWAYLAGCATHPAGAAADAKATADTKSRNIVIKEVLSVKTKELHQLPVSPAGAKAPETSVAPTPEPVAPESSGETDLTAEYRIQPGDLLDFQSFDDASLTRQVMVRYDGQISLPLVPDLNVENATREEATTAIRTAYSTVFKDPQVTLTIRDAASKVYYMMGDVMRPMEYPYRRPISVLGAINLAGGMRVNQRGGDTYVGAQGQLTKALIIRHEDGARNVMELDLRGLSLPGEHASDTPVLPGDIVYVPEGVNLVYLIGEVRRSDVFPLAEGMTLLQLLARAGGPAFTTAKLDRVVLMREVDADTTKLMLLDVRQMLRTGQDFVLQPGDIIYLPRKNLVRLQEFVQRFTGTISPILNLYRQAYDAYYTKARFEKIFENTNGDGGILGVLQDLTAFGGLLTGLPATP